MLDKHPAEGESMSFQGSMMMVLAETKEEAEALLRNDIYTKSGVWDMDKAQIIPVCVYSLLLLPSPFGRPIHHAYLFTDMWAAIVQVCRSVGIVDLLFRSCHISHSMVYMNDSVYCIAKVIVPLVIDTIGVSGFIIHAMFCAWLVQGRTAQQ